MSNEANAWRTAFEDLHNTLRHAQTQRKHLHGWVDNEPEWVTHERVTMTDRVNLLRARRGDGPVAIKDVARKEQMACGHVDYTKKYALYCADLVVSC